MYKCHERPLDQVAFKIQKVPAKVPSRYQGQQVCDTPITFDIETTSCYLNKAGQPVVYDYDNPQMEYKAGRRKVKMPRCGIMYHWQFNVGGSHYTGRTWEDLRLFFDHLAVLCPARKFVYVHNLAFEFGWIANAITFSEPGDKVLAREPHRVMTAYSAEYNLEFRCSYYLTNMSLAKWGAALGVPKSKDLDYNVLRTPLTPLDPAEVRYCLIDVDIVYAGILKYRDKYKHLYNIPITQTGEVRRELRKVYKNEHQFYNTCRKLQPRNLKQLRWMLSAFYGGCVLASPTFKDELLKGPFIFKDLASSYPWALLSERYPLTPFRKVRQIQQIDKYMQDPDKTYIIDFDAYDVSTKVPCLFLSSSKLTDVQGLRTMNGRVATAEHFHCILAQPDFELFKKCYEADIVINFIKISELEYLPDGFRRFIIDKYKDKTALKTKDPDIYQISKMIINALYGINCQKLLTDEVRFDVEHTEGDCKAPWYIEPLTEDNFYAALQKVLYNENGSPKKLYTATQIGIYCTAYARKNLFYGVLGENEDGDFLNVEDVIYTDTDSIKMLRTPEAEDVFDCYNSQVLEMHKIIADQLGVDPADLSPLDDNGVPHPIGVFAEDGSAEELKVLGAKKYCYRDDKEHKLHLTVAGVPKEGVNCLHNDLNEFRDGKVFTAKALNEHGDKTKMAPVYIIDQPPIRFPDGYISDDKYAVCLTPIDYTLSKSYDMYSPPDEFFKVIWGNSRDTKLFKT